MSRGPKVQCAVGSCLADKFDRARIRRQYRCSDLRGGESCRAMRDHRIEQFRSKSVTLLLRQQEDLEFDATIDFAEPAPKFIRPPPLLGQQIREP